MFVRAYLVVLKLFRNIKQNNLKKLRISWRCFQRIDFFHVSSIPPSYQVMTSDLQASGLRHLVDEIQEQFLLCQICRKSYSRPKNLSCLHTFCLKCIETTHENEVSSKKYGDPREVTCPICLKKSQLPIGGPRNLMDNFLVLNLSELVEKQKSSVEETPLMICDICKEENPVLEHKKDSTQEKVDKVQPKPMKRKSFMSADFTLSILSDKHYEACKKGENEEDDDDDDDEEVTQCNGEVTEENKDSGSQNHVNGGSQSDPESESHKVAVSKCLECNKLLCASCIKKHQSMKVTSRHSMIDVETEKDVECKEHPGEPVRLVWMDVTNYRVFMNSFRIINNS